MNSWQLIVAIIVLSFIFSDLMNDHVLVSWVESFSIWLYDKLLFVDYFVILSFKIIVQIHFLSLFSLLLHLSLWGYVLSLFFLFLLTINNMLCLCMMINDYQNSKIIDVVSILALNLLAQILIVFYYISVIDYDHIHRLIFINFCDFQILFDTSYYVATFMSLLFLHDLIISTTHHRVIFDAAQYVNFVIWLAFRVAKGISIFFLLCKRLLLLLIAHKFWSIIRNILHTSIRPFPLIFKQDPLWRAIQWVARTTRLILITLRRDRIRPLIYFNYTKAAFIIWMLFSLLRLFAFAVNRGLRSKGLIWFLLYEWEISTLFGRTIKFVHYFLALGVLTWLELFCTLVLILMIQIST